MKPPVFVLDSKERLRPVPVEAGTLVPNAAVVMKDGRRVPFTSLDVLTSDAVAIDYPPDPERWVPQVQKGQPLVGYHRQMQDQGLLWDQFWVNWLDDPKAYAGEGRHEGDWEMVQVGYGLGGVPVCMTCSQHHSGANRWWHDVTLDDGAPVVYVARDSHANYFAPVDSIVDRADGRGVRVVLEWREFGPWAMWPGRWGHSNERSPRSPGRQGDRWHEPALYNSRTRPA